MVQQLCVRGVCRSLHGRVGVAWTNVENPGASIEVAPTKQNAHSQAGGPGHCCPGAEWNLGVVRNFMVYIFILFYLVCVVCVCCCLQVPQHTCGGRCSPPTMRVPGVELGTSGLVASVSSHCASQLAQGAFLYL